MSSRVTPAIDSEEWQSVEDMMLRHGIIRYNGLDFTMTKEFASRLKTASEEALVLFVDLARLLIGYNSQRTVEAREYLDCITVNHPSVQANVIHSEFERTRFPNLELNITWLQDYEGNLVRPIMVSTFPGTVIDVDIREAINLEGHVTLALYKFRTEMNPCGDPDFISMEHRTVRWPRSPPNPPAEFHASIAYKTEDPDEEGMPIMYQGGVTLAAKNRMDSAFTHIRSANECVEHAAKFALRHQDRAQFERGAPYNLEVDENLIYQHIGETNEHLLQMRTLCHLKDIYDTRAVEIASSPAGAEERERLDASLLVDLEEAERRWEDEAVVTAFCKGERLQPCTGSMRVGFEENPPASDEPHLDTRAEVPQQTQVPKPTASSAKPKRSYRRASTTPNKQAKGTYEEDDVNDDLDD